ncbi:hypothetical protein VDG1235_1068 [Verrucomicrobiia bacterium DG1235]|nr:hypothetical protein VDG1235_1068 [Verrucomicrobiae bacterium DG1235]
MTSGTFTFSSIARLSDYQTSLAETAKKRQAEATPAITNSPSIPTGPVDPRTDQALLWSGLKSAESSKDSSQAFSFSGLGNTPALTTSAGFQAPDIDLAYNFVTMQNAFAYRDAVLSRNPDASSTLGQNLSAQS